VDDNCKEIKEEILEDLQEAASRAGGKFFRKAELLQMPFEQILDSFVSNGVRIHFYISSKKRNSPSC